MDHISIQAALNRILSTSGKISLVAHDSDQLTAKGVKEFLADIAATVNHLATVVNRIASKQQMESDDYGFKF